MSVQVLSTMDAEGKRIRLRPRPSQGRFHRRRGIVAFALIALFVGLPFVNINGRPALLIDLVRREIALGGLLFRPSDGVVLMLLGLKCNNRWLIINRRSTNMLRGF